MTIFLTPSTAGRYGGALNGNLRHLPDWIEDELKKVGFESSFEELRITICYPPMYVLPGVEGIEADFMENFNKLPYSRMDRRYKRIDVTLPCPEFSEHFDGKEKARYDDHCEIADEYLGLSEIELSQILIEKYIEAGLIIKSKLKKTDKFDSDLFIETLKRLKNNVDLGFLKKMNKEQAKKNKISNLNNAIKAREFRKDNKKPANTLLRDIRVYYDKIPIRALYPYDHQYSEIFLNTLSNKGFECPDYHHIYIQIEQNEQDALINAFSIEDWHAYGISTIDYQSYITKSEEEKSEIVFETIANGLRDIAKLDGLDTDLLESAISQIKSTGLDSILTYKTVEHSNYKLSIKYHSRSMEEKNPIFGELLEKESGRTREFSIGKADKTQLSLWLQNINLTNKLIKIKSSDSGTADVWLKDLPRQIEFDIESIMK